MSLQTLIEKLYGVKTRNTINPVISQVDNSIKTVLKPNPDRLGFTIINLSANTVYIGFTNDVSANKGIFLSANGGNLTVTYDEDLVLPSLEVFGIAPAGASNIYVIEILGDR